MKYACKPLQDPILPIDLSNCRSPGELHLLLKEKSGLPEYYGENWPALWDCLDGLFEDEGDIGVEIWGCHKMSTGMQDACEPMRQIFGEVSRAAPNVCFIYID